MNAPKESPVTPSINSLLLRTCHDLNTSLLNLIARSTSNLSIKTRFTDRPLSTNQCKFRHSQCRKSVTGGVLRTIPWQRLWYQVRDRQRKKGKKGPPARNKEKL
jgi:hypothetical protein